MLSTRPSMAVVMFGSTRTVSGLYASSERAALPSSSSLRSSSPILPIPPLAFPPKSRILRISPDLLFVKYRRAYVLLNLSRIWKCEVGSQSSDGTYAMKKVLIQNSDQLEMVRDEIHVSSQFNHPNLLPLLDHAIIAVKASQDHSWKHEAYLLFPVHLDGTLLDNTTAMKAKKEFFSTSDVLKILHQLCAGLKHMHSFDPPYAHNDVKPGNVLVTRRKGQPPVAILMDFGSARPARKQIRSRSEALQLQEWASEHCSAPFRAPELWDCPSHADIDERTDIWSLGCTLFAIMYGESPFEYALGESGGSLQLAIVNAQVKWPAGPNPPYPDALHQFVKWMLQPQATVRPRIDDIIIHVEKLVAKFSD
ncbi:hypothetical protein SASPL_125013 [Salvia splendens]|uniref:non-specific serine/threonine protein kinase n=1 Tax=Salvia splendens TaxID=180675 RepID=A0A8X8XJ53_SALSN|nr:hypothetical protein SASPL_125013 [Salvia splendens]